LAIRESESRLYLSSLSTQKTSPKLRTIRFIEEDRDGVLFLDTDIKKHLVGSKDYQIMESLTTIILINVVFWNCRYSIA